MLNCELTDRGQTAAGTEQPLIHAVAEPTTNTFDQRRIGRAGQPQSTVPPILRVGSGRIDRDCHGKFSRPVK